MDSRIQQIGDELPGRASRLGRQGVLLAFLALPGLIALGLASVGLERGESVGAAFAAVLYTWLTSGVLAVGFLLSAIGYGLPLSRLLAGSPRDRLWLQPACGLAVLLFVDHLVGVLGGFSGSHGRWVAAFVMAVGVGMVAGQGITILKTRPRLPTVPWPVLMCCASVGLLLIAACSPPGSLWRSEAGGFDALSYHLPLAQEWAQGDRLWPLSHNVYSFLPSYAEAGFTQIAALCGGSLVAGDGVGLLACQFVHVEQTFIAALTVGALAAGLARRCGVEAHGQGVAGGLAFAVLLAVPWTAVVGSLAYNEMAAVALAAGGGLVAVSDGTPLRRGLGAGLLLGAATACKPTFFFLAGPTVGLLLLGMVEPRLWWRAVGAGMVGGLLMLGPPLARNWVACGSPVFPLSMAMGTAHWDQEQAERFVKGHRRDGTIAQQVELLLAAVPPRDPLTGMSSSFDGEPRGMLHGQWGMMFPSGLCAMCLLFLRRGTRWVAGTLLIGVLAGCVFWVVSTHAQSRFLIPLLPNLACAIGVLGGWIVGDGESVSPLRRLSLIFVCVLPLLASAASVRLFLTEQGGRPNRLLTAGAGWLSGEGLAARQNEMSAAQRKEIEDGASPQVFVAITMRAGEKLMLLGDATPLYYLVPTVYNTVWDRSVLGLAMQNSPHEPAKWMEAVRATGSTHLLVNLAEIERYRRTYGFDPGITPERLELFLFRLGEPVKVWMYGDRPGMLLFELPVDPQPQGGSGGTV